MDYLAPAYLWIARSHNWLLISEDVAKVECDYATEKFLQTTEFQSHDKNSSKALYTLEIKKNKKNMRLNSNKSIAYFNRKTKASTFLYTPSTNLHMADVCLVPYSVRNYVVRL